MAVVEHVGVDEGVTGDDVAVVVLLEMAATANFEVSRNCGEYPIDFE